jgi:hypothetical protein
MTCIRKTEQHSMTATQVLIRRFRFSDWCNPNLWPDRRRALVNIGGTLVFDRAGNAHLGAEWSNGQHAGAHRHGNDL